MKSGDIVRVEWQDATMFSGWHTWSEASGMEPEMCVTVGFVLPRTLKDKTNLWLVMTRTPNHVGDVLAIPKKWIIDLKVIK